MKNYQIYVLKDPFTLEVRYVGVTQRTLKERLYHHIWESKKDKGSHKKHWINSLIKKKSKPLIELIEICDKDNWIEREKYWIGFFNNLTNTSKGGVGLIIGRDKSSIERSASAHKKKICQLSYSGEFIKFWDSASDAAKAFNISSHAIFRALSKKNSSAIGYCWCYPEEVDSFVSKVKDRKDLISNFQRKSKIRIITIDNKEHIFDTITEASKVFGFSTSYLSQIINGKKGKTRFILIERM